MNTKNPIKLLITGASGFVGRHFISKALERYGDSVQIKALYFGGRDPFYDDKRVESQELNITSAKALKRVIEAFCPTAILHLAAISHVPTARKEPETVWHVNAIGTLRLVETLRKYYPDVTFLNVSSSEIYGGSFLSGNPVDEMALLQPRNAYASSKAAADILAR